MIKYKLRKESGSDILIKWMLNKDKKFENYEYIQGVSGLRSQTANLNQ